MGKSSQEDTEATGKSCASLPQCHDPSYSVVVPRGVINSPAVYQEPDTTLEHPRPRPEEAPEPLPGAYLPGRAVGQDPRAGRVQRRPWRVMAGRRQGWRWGLTWPVLTHSQRGGGGSASSSGHRQSRSRCVERSCVFSVFLSSGEGGQGLLPPASGRGAGRPPSLSQAPTGLSDPGWMGPLSCPRLLQRSPCSGWRPGDRLSGTRGGGWGRGAPSLRGNTPGSRKPSRDTMMAVWRRRRTALLPRASPAQGARCRGGCTCRE